MQCNIEFCFVFLARYQIFMLLERLLNMQGLCISSYANQGETYKDISLNQGFFILILVILDKNK